MQELAMIPLDTLLRSVTLGNSLAEFGHLQSLLMVFLISSAFGALLVSSSSRMNVTSRLALLTGLGGLTVLGAMACSKMSRGLTFNSSIGLVDGLFWGIAIGLDAFPLTGGCLLYRKFSTALEVDAQDNETAS